MGVNFLQIVFLIPAIFPSEYFHQVKRKESMNALPRHSKKHWEQSCYSMNSVKR